MSGLQSAEEPEIYPDFLDQFARLINNLLDQGTLQDNDPLLFSVWQLLACANEMVAGMLVELTNLLRHSLGRRWGAITDMSWSLASWKSLAQSLGSSPWEEHSYHFAAIYSTLVTCFHLLLSHLEFYSIPKQHSRYLTTATECPSPWPCPHSRLYSLGSFLPGLPNANLSDKCNRPIRCSWLSTAKDKSLRRTACCLCPLSSAQGETLSGHPPCAPNSGGSSDTS